LTSGEKKRQASFSIPKRIWICISDIEIVPFSTNGFVSKWLLTVPAQNPGSLPSPVIPPSSRPQLPAETRITLLETLLAPTPVSLQGFLSSPSLQVKFANEFLSQKPRGCVARPAARGGSHAPPPPRVWPPAGTSPSRSHATSRRISPGLKVYFGCFASRGTCCVTPGRWRPVRLSEHLPRSVRIRTQAHSSRPSQVSLQDRSTRSSLALSKGGAEPSSAKARAPHPRRGGGRGGHTHGPAPPGSDLGGEYEPASVPDELGAAVRWQLPPGARGVRDRAPTSRVSGWSETNSSGSSQAPDELDLDSFHLQLSYLWSPIAVFLNLIYYIVVNEIM